MKLVINRFKKTPLWCYVAIFVIIMVGVNIHVTSKVTENIIAEKMESVPEMVIMDDKAFGELQTHFSNRYGADASLTYLLQPKDYVKLYKESIKSHVTDSLTILHAPNRVNLTKESIFQLDLKKQEYVKITEDSKQYENYKLLNINREYKTIYVFPIYHYRTHVAEIMFFYKDDVNLSKEDIITRISELQVLRNYIK